MRSYQEFLASKAPRFSGSGMTPYPMPDTLEDFQQHGVDFLLRNGRGLCAYDTGLGKGRMALECLRQSGLATNGQTLHMVPLAVARQIEKEGRNLGYDVQVIGSMDDVRPGINVCNYDRLDKLDPTAFGAVSLDEADILASLTGATARLLIEMFNETKFRFCWSATPAPNDHTELGAQSEFLGVMKSKEMLSRWFINDTATASQEWRLKGHAVNDFWDWVASWARCASTPDDLGFDGSKFILPLMEVFRHHVEMEYTVKDDMLFASDVSATAMHAKKRETAESRAKIVADIIAREPDETWLLWCDNDAESDALVNIVPNCVDIRGSYPQKRQEKILEGFTDGTIKRLACKPVKFGKGMNWWHCARMIYIGRSFSYRLWYQSARRCWRFGQKRQVHCHLVVEEGEAQIGRVIDRKAGDHDTMKTAMAAAMMRANGTVSKVMAPYKPNQKMELPAWLTV